MMQSLRSRLIVGMLLGMAVLLVAAGATINARLMMRCWGRRIR